ncbi:MAG: putative transcriptional regulator [Puniceicoccaceae bacterium 5H]|nr:MAG: putative transcriptional regulator [Puniceicoccaceae bacterium 5H]
MARTHIRNHIRTLRFMAGEMTQQALAEQIGVTRQTVVAIEKGKYSPSLEVAFKIARVFRKPLEEVFQYQPVEAVFLYQPEED